MFILKTNTKEKKMDTRLATVDKNMNIDGLSGNCLNELRKQNLIDVIGRMRVDPMDERVQKIMRKFNTTLFVL